MFGKKLLRSRNLPSAFTSSAPYRFMSYGNLALRVTVRLPDDLGQEVEWRTDNVSVYVTEALCEKLQLTGVRKPCIASAQLSAALKSVLRLIRHFIKDAETVIGLDTGFFFQLESRDNQTA